MKNLRPSDEEITLFSDKAYQKARESNGITEALHQSEMETIDFVLKHALKEMVEWLEQGCLKRAFLIAEAALPMYEDIDEWAENSTNILILNLMRELQSQGLWSE